MHTFIRIVFEYHSWSGLHRFFFVLGFSPMRIPTSVLLCTAPRPSVVHARTPLVQHNVSGGNVDRGFFGENGGAGGCWLLYLCGLL